MRDSESKSKIKVRSPWTFPNFSLCQQLFAFKKSFTETRLYNIFKSKNAVDQAHYRKLLQSSVRQNFICYHQAIRACFMGCLIFNNFKIDTNLPIL